MSVHEFWYEDCRLFECYIKAHHDKVNEVAWLNGLYAFEAVSAAINNVMPGAIGTAFSKNHKVKPIKYHDKPIELYEKHKEEKPEIDNYAFNDWVHKFRRLNGIDV